MIIVMNDQGTAAKNSLYERGIRIMQFIRYPSLFSNKEIFDNFVVSNVDIAATLFELAGLDLNDLKALGYKLDGESWLNAITTNDTTNFQYRFTEVYQTKAIVTKEYKYIWHAQGEYDADTNYPYAGSTHEFYDLITNPRENVSIYNDSSYNTTLFWLQDLLNIHVNSTCPILPARCRRVRNQNNHYSQINKEPTDEPTSKPTTAPIEPSDSPTPQPVKSPTVMPLEFDNKPNFIIFHIDDFDYLRFMSESYPRSPNGAGDYIELNATWISRIRNEGFIFPLS